MIKQEPYDKACDLFSYGTVLWELVTHKVPFEELQGAFQIMTAVTSGNVRLLKSCMVTACVLLFIFVYRCLTFQMMLMGTSLS